MRGQRGFTLTETLVSVAIMMIVMTVLLAVLEATFRTLRIVAGETNAQERARLAMRYLTNAVGEAASFTKVMHPDLMRDDSRAQYEAELVANGNCDPSNIPVAFAPMPNRTLWRQDLDTSCLIEPGEVGVDPDLTFSSTFSQGVAGVPAPCAPDPYYIVPGAWAIPDGNLATVAALSDRNQNPDHPVAGRSLLEAILQDATTEPAWLSAVACGYAPYQTAWEDLDGDGVMFASDPLEGRLRTLVFSVINPTYAAGEGTNVPANADDQLGMAGQREQVERRVVTIAHTWREKSFLIPYSESMALACDPEESNHLETDFVIYQRITRFYADPWVNMDIDQDGSTADLVFGRDLEDECLRTVETPLVTGIADLRFRLFTGDGSEIRPGNGYLSPQGESLDGTFFYATRGGDEPFTSLTFVRRVEITVLAASDHVLDVIRRTMGPRPMPPVMPFVTGLPFQVMPASSLQELGRVDFLGIVAGVSNRRLYNAANFIQLRETVDLRFWGGV
ncbi:type II secretion system protein [bacterium]|nr:type II secretion system protein [bacterium]